MQVIITTVGTSLLSNRERPWAGWRFGSPLPESGVVDGWLADADPVVAGEGAALLRKLAAEDYLPRSQVANLLKGDGRLEMLVESEDIDDSDHVCPNLLGTLARGFAALGDCAGPDPVLRIMCIMLNRVFQPVTSASTLM